jgi:hypothetical protein
VTAWSGSQLERLAGGRLRPLERFTTVQYCASMSSLKKPVPIHQFHGVNSTSPLGLVVICILQN